MKMFSTREIGEMVNLSPRKTLRILKEYGYEPRDGYGGAENTRKHWWFQKDVLDFLSRYEEKPINNRGNFDKYPIFYKSRVAKKNHEYNLRKRDLRKAIIALEDKKDEK